MKTSTFVSISAVALASLATLPVAQADTAEANCQVRKDGDTKQGASGPCSFSQRQGYVDIDLRNGDSVSLTPTDQPNRYRDQNGKAVTRTVSGNSQEYKWEHRKIIVTFNQGGYGAPPPRNPPPQGQVGETPRDLISVQNSMAVGGEVETEMNKHGYKLVRNEPSGDDVYSYYRSKSTGQCVVVRLDGERQIMSIVNATPQDCK